jgi:hypothetical protein
MSDPESIDPSPMRPGPIRHESLHPNLLEQIRAIYEVLGQYFDRTLEQFEIGFMREANPEDEVGIWLGIMVVWIDYHEKYLDDEVMSDADEQKLLSALMAISSGVDDPSKLGVPTKIGQRLLECYEQFESELGDDADEG